MIEKIRAKFRKKSVTPGVQDTYKKEDVRKLVGQAYAVGYNDGKRDGLAVARQQATNSLKEILWEANKTK